MLLPLLISKLKYAYFKKGLKQRRRPSLPPPQPLPPAESKVFSRRKSHLTTAVICNLIGYFRQPRKRKTILKVPRLRTIVTNHRIQWFECLQLNKTAYTAFKPLSISSTKIDICINNIDFRVVSLSVSHCINCAHWDHEEKKQSLFCHGCVWDSVSDYPTFQGISVWTIVITNVWMANAGPSS